MMPGLDGLEVCKALRARGRSTPILMLTAKSTELDRVLGLELGADDYLTKPFSLAELLARVKALLRRADLLRAAQAHPGGDGRTIRNGGLEILPTKRQVRFRGAAARVHGARVRPAAAFRDRTRATCSRAASCSTRSGATPTTATSTR